MATNVNWFDRLSSPQYTTPDGRFNLLSLFQLPYAFTPAGGREVARRKNLTERGQTAAVEQAEAGVDNTRASTSDTEAVTSGRNLANLFYPQQAQQNLKRGAADIGQVEAETSRTGSATRSIDLSNQAFQTQQQRAAAAAGREDAARLALPASGGVPGEIRPEFEALSGPLDEAARARVLFDQQQRMAEMGLGETQGLVNGELPKFPITQPGQVAAASERGGQAVKSELTSLETRAKQNAAVQMITAAMQTLDPRMMQVAIDTARRMGVDVAQFTQPGQSGGMAREIDNELQARKAAPAPAAAAAPAPKKPASFLGIPVTGGAPAQPPQQRTTAAGTPYPGSVPMSTRFKTALDGAHNVGSNLTAQIQQMLRPGPSTAVPAPNPDPGAYNWPGQSRIGTTNQQPSLQEVLIMIEQLQRLQQQGVQ